MKSYKEILKLHNEESCDVCGTRCRYYYNHNFEFKKTDCIGYRLSITYKILMKIYKLFRRL